MLELEDVGGFDAPPKKFQGHQPAGQLVMPTSLDQIDLSKELLENYQIAKAFLYQILNLMDDDEDSRGKAGDSPNQIAAVINSVKSSLAEIIKLQTEVNNADRFMKLEQAMISAIKVMPEEARTLFMERYEEIVKKAT